MMLLVLASLALAQGEALDVLPAGLSIEPSGSFREAGVGLRFQEKGEPFVIDVGLHGRVSFPIGKLQDSDNIVISGPGGTVVIWEDHLRYADLFKPGLGLSLEGSILFIQPEGRRFHGSSPSFGIYAAIHEDEFDGESATDDLGNELSAKDMRITSGFVGIKMAQSMGSQYFTDVRIGGGLVRYEEVKGKYSTGVPGVGPFEGAILEESTNYAFELRGHGGVRFGPVAFVAGVGARVFGQPDSGNGAGELGLSPKTLFTLDFDIGVEIGF